MLETSKKILVVEDNGPTLSLIGSILTPAGYDVHLADNIEKALYIMKQGGVKLAIVDHYLGDKTAFDFVISMEVDRPTFPMILITAHETKDLLVKGRTYGYGQILKKPFEAERLLKLVASAMRPPRA